MESICLTIETGKFPRDAWLTVEIFEDRVVIEDCGCFCDVEVDFSPALEWAADCTLERGGVIPEGWRLQVAGPDGELVR